jgi:hypothetical protein
VHDAQALKEPKPAQQDADHADDECYLLLHGSSLR